MKKRQIIPQAPLSANRFFEKELENGSINQIVSRDLSVEVADRAALNHLFGHTLAHEVKYALGAGVNLVAAAPRPVAQSVGQALEAYERYEQTEL